MRRRFALALIVLAAPASAGCRLSTADCEIVAREVAAEDAAQEHDAQSFAPAMPAYPRGRALIERHFARNAERYRHLPARIADEWARMEMCDAAAEAGTETPARCR